MPATRPVEGAKIKVPAYLRGIFPWDQHDRARVKRQTDRCTFAGPGILEGTTANSLPEFPPSVRSARRTTFPPARAFRTFYRALALFNAAWCSD